MTYSKEDIQKRFDAISPNLKQAIATLKMEEITDDLRKKYKLHVDQLEKIALEITYTMLGLSGINNFSNSIQTKASVSEDVANLITYDVNQQVFAPIRKELMEMAQGAETEQKETPKKENVFDQKMSGTYNVPTEKVEVKAETSDNVDTKPLRDPYREQIG